MKEIDWSKAPEGAEFWCDDQWFKSVDGEWFVWYPGAISWAKPAYKAPDNFSWWGNAVQRPSKAWSGTGLPPIGAKVVLCDTDYVVFEPYKEMIGVEVTVVASFASPAGFDMIACALPDGLCGCFRADMARPIRTPEQIAAEERERAISEMLRIYTDGAAGHCGGIAALYDAGYRRQEHSE